MLASPTPNPHARIGRYEVLQKIATGGMAELFLAKQVGMEGFEKVVAIKRILAHLAHDEEFINMFRDEARIVAKLSHPNIVQIYDLGKSEETYFIAMEYIPGRNLSSVAKKSRKAGEALPPEYIARCIAQACEGLHYAHTRREMDGKPLEIVHRDVSPQNIIVSFSGTVKLVDFGIAKAATKFAHTRAGVLKGKYAYMSPEQIRGEAIDARSDVFAAGIVLYELLAGRRPFEKNNSIQTLKAIVQDPHRDCRELNGDIPDELADVIHRALEKSIHERYQSAQDLQVALEDFIQNSSQRVNNITISRWVNTLFADELSKEQGGTVTLRGVGEVILPDVANEAEVDEALAADDAERERERAAQEAEASPSQDFSPAPTMDAWGGGLGEGLRGGGSVDPERPPILAPSNSMVNSRDSLIEEAERSGDLYDGGFDEGETEFGFEPQSGHGGVTEGQTDYDGADDTGEVPEAVVLEDTNTTGVPAAPEAPKAEVMSEDVTWSPQGLEPPVDPDGADQWNEATVGYPGDGYSEAAFGESAAEWSGASLDAFAAGSVSDDDWEGGGGYSAEVDSSDADLGAVELPDIDLIAESDDLPLDDAFDFPESVLPEDGPEIDATIAQPGLPEEPDRDSTMAQHNFPPGLLPESEDLPDATIAAGEALDEDMIARAAIEALMQEPERPEGLPENVEASFDDGATVAYSKSDEWVADADVESLDDDFSIADPDDPVDATIAAAPRLETGEIPTGAFDDAHEETVQAMDAEPQLPGGVVVSDRDNNDARTVAGQTADYVTAGVRPEQEPYDVSSAETTQGANNDDAPLGMPKQKRGQEALGAIQLSKRPVSKGDLSFPGSSELPDSDFDGFDMFAEPSQAATPDLDDAPISGEFDLGLDEDGAIPALPPGPLIEDNQPLSAKDAYSELVQPVMPSDMDMDRPPPGEEEHDDSIPSGLGSGNVPPAHMSLSQVLQNPQAARPSGMNYAPGRSQSLVGRQIKEVVRSESGRPASQVATAPPPSSLDLPTERALPASAPEPLNLPQGPPAAPQSKRAVIIAGIVAVLAVMGVAMYLLAPKLFGPLERLDVRSSPPGAKVLINGTVQARATPLSITGLVPGREYNVRVELEGYEPTEEVISLKKDQQLIYTPVLNRKGKVVE